MTTKKNMWSERAQTKTMELAVSNIGPVKDQSFTLEPGVNILAGDNGVGKSTVLASLAAALSDKKGDFDLTPRDGTNKGTVRLNGTTLLVVGKVNRKSGEAAVSLASTSPLGDLVEPGIKDKAAAERARISALLQLVDAPVTDEVIEILTEGDKDALAYLDETEGLDILKGLDLVTAANRIRMAVHKYKRLFESEAEIAEGEMRANLPEGPAVMTEKSVAEATAEHETAIRKVERLSGEASQRAEREAEREKIRKNLGQRPNVDEALLHVEQMTAIAIGRRGEVTQLGNEIAALQLRLVAATGVAERADASVQDAQAALTETQSVADQWDQNKFILDSDITGATADDVTKAEAQAETTRTALENARLTATYREVLARRDAAAKRREVALEKMETYEKLAIGVTGRLGIVLANAGVPNITVEGDRLCVIDEHGHLEAVSRLSFGERTKLAVGLIPIKSEEGAVLPLDWKFWNSLAPHNQKEAAQIFKDAKIYALTEKPTEGELRLERAE